MKIYELVLITDGSGYSGDTISCAMFLFNPSKDDIKPHLKGESLSDDDIDKLILNGTFNSLTRWRKYKIIQHKVIDNG